ncbi:uncharacterized protein LOC111315191 [Durio zibethinus]|uniref:Uncharacterized protein LOC111315191 n=1 Tax=Durio zibethinus TaxID=66656 RepID=A0A6P6B5R0_DURZI|nr:uncharacterized protein LOC111315191 [Durio zibethinus]
MRQSQERRDDINVRRAYSTDKERIINEFWLHFYREIKVSCKLNSDCYSYQDRVIMLLNESKKNQSINNDGFIEFSSSELKDLQNMIEELTMNFDENRIFKSTPQLLNLLIDNAQITAKDHLKSCLSTDVYNRYISHLGHYTLEAIIIYVLGLLYNSLQESSVVRVSTLLDSDSSQAVSDSSQAKSSKKSRVQQYEIGTKLLEFMLERNCFVIDTCTTEEIKPIVKRKGKGYYPLNSFVICNFNCCLLPVKLNLPMVCKPLDWKSKCLMPRMFSDIRGGYFFNPSNDLYNQFKVQSSFRVISSRDIHNFNIHLHDPMYKEMCQILNRLQSQGLLINNNVLEFIKKNHASLEKLGLLAHVNMKEAIDLLKICYLNDGAVKDLCSFRFLLTELA